MPHMMPMMWTLIMMFSLMTLFTIISMTYFTHTSTYDKSNSMYSYKLKNNWDWKW